MKVSRKLFGEMAEMILEGGAYKVTKILDETTTIKATRRLFKYNGRKPDNRKQTEILFTIGRPNYEEREKIKAAKKEGRKVAMTITRYPPKNTKGGK